MKFWSVFAAAVVIAAAAVPAPAAEVRLSGEIRVRHELTRNADFSNASDDSTQMTTERSRLNALATVDDQTTVFVSLQDTRAWGSCRGS